jgi:hypothetical protein
MIGKEKDTIRKQRARNRNKCLRKIQSTTGEKLKRRLMKVGVKV